MKKIFGLLVGMMLLAGCATPRPTTGILGEYRDKLGPGTEGGAKLAWVKPRVNFSQYNKLMVDYVVFALAEDSESKVIDGEEMKKLGDTASQALVNTIKEKYPIVAEPGPDVARIKVAIVGLKQSRPALSGFSSVMPIGLGISIIKKGATDSWTGSGATQAELMALDSTTNEVIVVAHDEYTAGFTERFSKWGSVEDAFKFWGERVVAFLDAAKPGK